MATVWMSPTFMCMSQGDLLEATRVRTSMDWCRAMALNVSVGQEASVSTILP